MASVDIQLSRHADGTLPYLTHWSRHEPAAIKRHEKGNTDHWIKSKHKNTVMFVRGNNNQTHAFSGERYPQESPVPSKRIQSCYNIDGNMKHIGNNSFTNLLLTKLNGNRPGDYHKTRPIRRHISSSSYYERARDGFKYWWKEPEKMSHGSKVWIGGKGNVFGTLGK